MIPLIALLLFLQSPPAQSEADKLEAAIKKVGERIYSVVEDGKVTGTMTLKCGIRTEEGQKVAWFEDTLERKVEGATSTTTYGETASLEGLSLIRADLAVTKGKESSESSVSMRDGEAYLSRPDGLLILRDVKGCVGPQSAQRLVGMKEQKVGVSLLMKVLVWTHPADEFGHEFKCVAKESIEIGGKKVDAFKWEQRWKGKLLDGTEAEKNHVAWYAADGTLLRYRTSQGEMTLVDKPAK